MGISNGMESVAGPLAPLYYSGQFVPLIVFFLLFLAIVKNNKLHHFVRFNCMQVSTCKLVMPQTWQSRMPGKFMGSGNGCPCH